MKRTALIAAAFVLGLVCSAFAQRIEPLEPERKLDLISAYAEVPNQNFFSVRGAMGGLVTIEMYDAPVRVLNRFGDPVRLEDRGSLIASGRLIRLADDDPFKMKRGLYAFRHDDTTTLPDWSFWLSSPGESEMPWRLVHRDPKGKAGVRLLYNNPGKLDVTGNRFE